ncbi:hypothetical protein ACJJTC_001048 [Scirpophaga incertulas]
MENRQTEGNLNLTQDTRENEEDDEETAPSASVPPRQKKTRVSKSTDLDEAILKAVNETNVDEDVNFALSLVPSLKNLTADEKRPLFSPVTASPYKAELEASKSTLKKKQQVKKGGEIFDKPSTSGVKYYGKLLQITEIVRSTVWKTFNGDAAKKKWKNLRDTFAKYLKSTKTTTEQAAKKNYGQWQWAEQMKFLKPHLTFAKTIDNINDPSENESIDQTDDAQNIAVDNNESQPVTQTSASQAEIIAARNASISNTPPGSNTLTQKNNNKVTPVNQVLEYFSRKSQKRSQSKIDDLEHIFIGYAKSVKRL